MEAYEPPASSTSPTSDYRPLSPGATLATAARLYRGNLGSMLLPFALVIVPLQVLQVVVYRSTIPHGAEMIGGRLYVPAGTTVAAAPRLVYELIESLLTLVVSAGVYRLLIARLLRQPVAIGRALSEAVDRWLPLVGLLLLLEVGLSIGLLLLFVPGIFLMITWCLAIPVLIWEGLSPVAALSRSNDLVRGHWWGTLGRLVLAVLVAVVPVIVGVVVVVPALEGSSILGSLIALAAVEGVLSIVFSPWLAAVTAVMYVDYRRRRGEDLEPHLSPAASIGLSG